METTAYFKLRNNWTQMKNKLFENETTVIFSMAPSTNSQRVHRLRYCFRRVDQNSSDICCKRLNVVVIALCYSESFLKKEKENTSPLIRIKSSLSTRNLLATPILVVITKTSMNVQTNVQITFKYLPRNAFHGAYVVNVNSWFNWALKNSSIGFFDGWGHWLEKWTIEIMFNTCSAVKNSFNFIHKNEI